MKAFLGRFGLVLLLLLTAVLLTVLRFRPAPPVTEPLQLGAREAGERAALTLHYVTAFLLAPGGGVGTPVLSESQGLTMLAALNAGDGDLFRSAYGYAVAHRTEAGLFSWEKDSPVNALVDDLRIYRAMEMGGADEAALDELEEALFQYNTHDGKPVDFYDSALGEKADRFTLCYADFPALDLLARRSPRWETVRGNALALVTGGRISAEFPLYHSWYHYPSGRYHTESIHMAEGLLTLLHLSQAGALPGEALDWLEARMDEGILYARYTVRGRPHRDGRFESTSVYALLAQVAFSEGRFPLAQRSLARLEALRVTDPASPAYGAFGNPDGSGVYPFDQLTAILAYQQMQGALS